MNEDLREAIECVLNGRMLMSDGRNAQHLLITTAEQVLKAESELPAKKELTPSLYEHEPITVGVFSGFNSALSLCLPILAKKNLRIAELENEREQVHIDRQLEHTKMTKYKIKIRELEEEVKKSKDVFTTALKARTTLKNVELLDTIDDIVKPKDGNGDKQGEE